jgi:hypothetical protein
MMTQDELVDWMRTELPKMLQADPMLRAQVIGVLSEVLVSKGELTQVLEKLRDLRAESNQRFEAVDRRFEAIQEEMRAMRADSNRRFEAMQEEMRAMRADFNQRFEAMHEEMRAMRADSNQRFEAIDRRFEAVDRRFEAVFAEFAALRAKVAEAFVGLGPMGRRLGEGLEDVIRQVIENFSGVGPLKAERLIVVDETGKVRHPGADVEFDALVTNGRKFLVEVKNYAEPDEVWSFYQKARLAETKLGETFEKVLIAPAATQSAVALAKQLGIFCHTFRVME